MSGYMPRNFSELKSGGGAIPMLSPHAEKWGGGRRVKLACMVISTAIWSGKRERYPVILVGRLHSSLSPYPTKTSRGL